MAKASTILPHGGLDAIRTQRVATERRLEQLRERERDLVSRLIARQRERDRRDDTRRKILVGAMLLSMTADAPELRAQLFAQLDAPELRAQLFAQLDVYLDRPGDRQLFGLDPRQCTPGTSSVEG